MAGSAEPGTPPSSGRLQGRGGAGNFLESSNDAAKEKSSSEATQQEALEKVARSVEEDLKRPAKAHLDVSRDRER